MTKASEEWLAAKTALAEILENEVPHKWHAPFPYLALTQTDDTWEMTEGNQTQRQIKYEWRVMYRHYAGLGKKSYTSWPDFAYIVVSTPLRSAMDTPHLKNPSGNAIYVRLPQRGRHGFGLYAKLRSTGRVKGRRKA